MTKAIKQLTISDCTSIGELLTAEPDGRNPRLTCHVMIDNLCVGLDLRKDLNARGPSSNQCNFLALDLVHGQLRIPVCRVDHFSSVGLATLDRWPLPLVEDAGRCDEEVAVIRESLPQEQIVSEMDYQSVAKTHLACQKILEIDNPFASVFLPSGTLELRLELDVLVHAIFVGCALQILIDLTTFAIVLAPLGIAFEGVLVRGTWNVAPHTRISRDIMSVTLISSTEIVTHLFSNQVPPTSSFFS